MKLNQLSEVIIICGHYGSGKTNFAVNLALDLKMDGRDVMLADLDIVNPYFRTADFADIAKANGIKMLASDYANTNLDIPALSISLDSAIKGAGTVVIDVGGDDVGATALGRYANGIENSAYSMIYVVNRNRIQISSADSALEILAEIEKTSRLKATHLVNNTHLGHETTRDMALSSRDYAEEISCKCKLPLLCSTINREFYKKQDEELGFYPIDIHVDLPWYK